MRVTYPQDSAQPARHQDGVAGVTREGPVELGRDADRLVAVELDQALADRHDLRHAYSPTRAGLLRLAPSPSTEEGLG